MKYALLLLFVLCSPPLHLLAREDESKTRPAVIIPQSDTSDIKDLSPNMAGKSLMTPAGWSAKGAFIFAGIGGTYPQAYTPSPDLIGVAGFGIGNSYKIVSIAAMANVNDVSAFNNFSLSVLATHTFTRGSSTIGAGVLQLFADPNKTDGVVSAFIRFSHTVQTVRSRAAGYSRLNYTIGVGTGRFLMNSDLDVLAGRNKYGTGVFGSVSYEVIRNINLNVEWTGVNLCTNVSLRPWAKLPCVSLGVADLTRYSGDKPRFVGSISYGFYLR